MAGRWFEEFSPGQSFAHEIRRTVTEADNMWFSNATCNPAAIHIDAEYCKGTEFGRPLVNSIFTLGLVIGLSERKLAKSAQSMDDVLILDLEDSVAQSRKAGARGTAADFIRAQADTLASRIFGLIHPLDKTLAMHDLAAG